MTDLGGATAAGFEGVREAVEEAPTLEPGTSGPAR